jgi:DNA-binding GntR family transcriptional regulator
MQAAAPVHQMFAVPVAQGENFMAVVAASNTKPASLAFPRAQSSKGADRKVSDQTIYDAVYEAVLGQRLPAGAKLPELELAELFGVSRSIVRKALTRLISDHVVEQRHSRIATVAKPSIEETRQIFEARRTVESETFRVTAGRLSKAEIQELRRLAEQEKEIYQQHGEHPSRTDHAMRLHLFIADHCPNRVLGNMQRELVLRTSIAISLYKSKGAGSCFLGDDHTRMVELLETGDSEEAAQLAREHLDAMRTLLDLSEEEAAIDLASILQVTKSAVPTTTNG